MGSVSIGKSMYKSRYCGTTLITSWKIHEQAGIVKLFIVAYVLNSVTFCNSSCVCARLPACLHAAVSTSSSYTYLRRLMACPLHKISELVPSQTSWHTMLTRKKGKSWGHYSTFPQTSGDTQKRPHTAFTRIFTSVLLLLRKSRNKVRIKLRVELCVEAGDWGSGGGFSLPSVIPEQRG